MKIPFTKPPTTYLEQVSGLKQRGMLITDDASAAFYLEHLNYYRLSAYWLPFEIDHQTHQLKAGTRFEDVLDLYVFDRELRLLILDAMERVEVSVRARWAYEMAHKHGAHAHLDSSLARSELNWQKDLDKLTEEVNRSQETFIKHLQGKYSEPLPPVWAVCEVMSLGLLSRWYSNLGPKQTRRAIADTYSLDEDTLASWLKHLTTVRNLCAHHSRLWDREFVKSPPQLPKTKPEILVGEFVPGSVRLYNTLVILLYLMDVIAPKHHWRQRLREFLLKHQQNFQIMSFPSDWDKKQIWQEVSG